MRSTRFPMSEPKGLSIHGNIYSPFHIVHRTDFWSFSVYNARKNPRLSQNFILETYLCSSCEEPAEKITYDREFFIVK